MFKMFRRKFAVKNEERRSLVVFDVPHNRFDDLFRGCGFNVIALKECQSGFSRCKSNFDCLPEADEEFLKLVKNLSGHTGDF